VTLVIWDVCAWCLAAVESAPGKFVFQTLALIVRDFFGGGWKKIAGDDDDVPFPFAVISFTIPVGIECSSIWFWFVCFTPATP
jgi:hypothetical protein